MPAKLGVFFIAAMCCGQTSLTQYFTLSPAQVSAISKLNADFQNYAYQQDAQSSTYQQQLAVTLQSQSPDPLVVGTAVANLELIRRDEVAKQSALQSSISAQLTVGQRSLVQNLLQAVELLPLTIDAGCAYLAPVLNSWFDVSYSPLLMTMVPTSLDRSGDFAIPPTPTIPGPPAASFCSSSMFPVSIRDYFTLTDAQIGVISQASAAYNDFYLRSQNRKNDLNVQIQAALATGSADAATLGLLYVAEDDLDRQISDRDKALRATAQAQLTQAQLAKLGTLLDIVALNQANLVYSAMACNLLTLPPGSSTGTLQLGVHSYCAL